MRRARTLPVAAVTLAGAALALAGARASAQEPQQQEMIEVEQAPPPPCCTYEAPPPPPSPSRGEVLFDVSLGPTYRRAFGEDFTAAAVEFEIGGQTQTWGVAGRARLDLGATRVGLPYQFATFGPAFSFHLSERFRLGFGVSFGSFSYQRASAARTTDPTVWAPTIGADLDATVDVLRTRRGGALFVAARAGWDFIDNSGDGDTFATGSSLSLTAALGYRY